VFEKTNIEKIGEKNGKKNKNDKGRIE